MGANLMLALMEWSATRWRSLLLLIILSIILPSCKPSPSVEDDPRATPVPFPTISEDENSQHLEAALAMIPDDVSHFSFTHWSRIKEHYRVPYLSGEFDEGEKNWLTSQVLENKQFAAMMDHDYLQQFETWGWDHHDLLWEAVGNYGLLTSTIRVQHLRSNFDYASLVDLLLERGFSQSTYRNVQLFSVPLTTETDWHRISPLEIHNIAIFPDENLLVLSPFSEGIHSVIDIRQGAASPLGDNPLIKRVVFKLIGTFAVELYQGSETCQLFGPGSFELGRNIGPAIEQLKQWPVQPYEIMAVGYFIAAGDQLDVVSFFYDDHRQAEIDFEYRENLFRFGISPIKTGVAYAAQFILDEGELEDALMTFHLIPSLTLNEKSGWPHTVIGWIQEGDALFAACVIEDFLGIDEIQ